MRTKLKILCLLFGIISTSCTRYQDLSKTYNLPQNVSSTGFDTLLTFQEQKEYHIRLVDDTEFYLLVDKTSTQSISGFSTDNMPALEFPKEKYQVVKLQQIAHAKVRVFDALKTSALLALFLGTTMISMVFIAIVISKPGNESEKSWMF